VRNWIVACYSVALIRGDTLTGIRIRHATLMGYIKQALALHTARGLPNPRLADIDYIKIMSNAVKKYESVPKRQEMISDGMFHFIARLPSQIGSFSEPSRDSGYPNGATTTQCTSKN